jgi:hypothetical protein
MQRVRTVMFIVTIVGGVLLATVKGGAAEEARPTPPQLPAVACAFAFSVHSHAPSVPHPSREWYLWRQPERVERQDVQRGESEIWRRGQDGQVFYERVFHRDKRIIEYVPGDLRALGKYLHWQQLSSVIDPLWLQNTLQRTGTTEVLGRRALRYQGQVHGVTLEIVWLEAEQLPALVRQVYPDREEVLRLTEIHPVDQAPWARVHTTHYQRTDYADLGDMHNDPFVRRIQQSAPRLSPQTHNH